MASRGWHVYESHLIAPITLLRFMLSRDIGSSLLYS